MSEDIGRILKSWEYDPQNSIRKVIDPDGGEKIQVRVDQGAFQGVLQMELDGRPDGKRPHNQTFAFDYYKETLRRHAAGGADPESFQLGSEACQEIFDESRRLYERYVFLLQIQDYTRVIRDTERNMEVFRFVNRYAESEEDQVALEKWWPYIIRIHAVARVMVATQNEDFDRAAGIIREAVEKINGLPDVEAEEFHVEKKRSIKALKELAEEIKGKKPPSREDALRQELEEAVEQEDFEKAARIRDEIRELEQEDEA
jgi:hypothetical protein